LAINGVESVAVFPGEMVKEEALILGLGLGFTVMVIELDVTQLLGQAALLILNE
jgi:hypothetical protein